MTDLNGKTVMITGAAGGIGMVLVEKFAAAGAAIAAVDASEKVHDLVNAHPDAGIATAVADICAPQEVDQAVAGLREKLGPITILVNNAGGSSCQTLEQTSPEIFANDVALNVNGAFNCFHAVRGDMKTAGDGVLINIASVNGFLPYGDPAYSVGKAGMINFTRAVALEYGRFGLRANTICPGTVRTPVWQHRVDKNPAILEELGRWYPLKRVVEPIEVARVAVFLASPDASAITGVALPVDCGLGAGNIEMTRAITMEEF